MRGPDPRGVSEACKPALKRSVALEKQGRRQARLAGRFIRGVATWQTSAPRGSADFDRVIDRASRAHRRVHWSAQTIAGACAPMRTFGPPCDAHACYGVSHDTATSCTYAARPSELRPPHGQHSTEDGSDPPVQGCLVSGSGAGAGICTHHATRPPEGRSRAIDPSGKGASAMLKPATLVLVGLASAAAIAHAFRAPFPGMRRQPRAGPDRLPRSGPSTP